MRPPGTVHDNETHIKRVQHRLELRVQIHDTIQRLPEFTFDPGNFVCDSLKIAACVFDQGFGMSAAIKLEPDSG